MTHKEMYAVEYKTFEGTTYEIFPTMSEALKFYSDPNTDSPFRIFVAEFNEDRIFQEEDGLWNYDDYADTYRNARELAYTDKVKKF